MSLTIHLLAAASLFAPSAVQGTSAALRVDLTSGRFLQGADLGLGETKSKDGHQLRADQQCLYLDGKPWLPAAGEFQYSRYPRSDWRDELLKMKAGGISVVGMYVFWNHIEEQRGVFNWSGQRDLHTFLTLCKDLGLKALVRMGPWCHGETRNGGFPDWVVAESKIKHFRLRTTDAGYLDCVRPYYKQLADQMKGLLWKDGGPIIGIQVDNECGNLPYLQTLKKLAREDGVDVPLYTMTGWAVPVPESGLIPMFGRYGEAFWLAEGDTETTKSYLINSIRDDGDMGIIGGKVGNMRADRGDQLARYPHMCIETGGGMQSTYTRRILMRPDDTGALALCRLASGANLLGYYIFQGAITPDGKFSSLNESTASGYPFDIPLKDYDFNAPITNCGLLRPSYHLLRQQHLFLQDFGNELASMPGYYPAIQPASLTDDSTLRWSVRSNGESGYLFFNNYQQVSTMAAKPGVQFEIQTKRGLVSMPTSPVTIPSNAYGIWPINQNCSGVAVRFATAQPLAHVSNGDEWYFYKATDGIQAEFSLGENLITVPHPGTHVAFTEKGDAGKNVHFVVLTASQAAKFWKFSMHGKDRVILCSDALLQTGAHEIRIETVGSSPSGLAIFPPFTPKSGKADGIFQIVPVAAKPAENADIRPTLVKPASPDPATKMNAMDEKAWSQAAIWKLPEVKGNTLLRIQYKGDVARLYAGGKLVMDNFYNGGPFDIGLWRIPAALRGALELRIMPLFKKDVGRLPSAVRAQLPDQASVVSLTTIQALEKRQFPVKL